MQTAKPLLLETLHDKPFITKRRRGEEGECVDSRRIKTHDSDELFWMLICYNKLWKRKLRDKQRNLRADRLFDDIRNDHHPHSPHA